MKVREAPHTQFPLTRCLVNVTYLCCGHTRRGPVLSHNPLEGSGSTVMNSKTMCNGKNHYNDGKNGSSVFAINGSDTETMMCGNQE